MRRSFTASWSGAIDLDQRRVTATAELPAEPYTCLLSRDGKTLFVSLWGGGKVLMLDATTLEARGEIQVGEHPNAMVLSRDGARLFVACANTNAVWVVDVAERTANEQISVALDAQAPVGSTPNGVSLSPDGRTLLIANADNNTVTVVDVSKPGWSQVEGFVPAGWYPTAVLFDRDGSRFFVLDGKGPGELAEHRAARSPAGRGSTAQYTGNMFQGAISTVPDANRCGAGPLLDAGARAHAVLGRAPARAGRCAARVADSASRRRQLADQIRLLRHSREPHVRPGAR